MVHIKIQNGNAGDASVPESNGSMGGRSGVAMLDALLRG
jgi:hypothetical protein